MLDQQAAGKHAGGTAIKPTGPKIIERATVVVSSRANPNGLFPWIRNLFLV